MTCRYYHHSAAKVCTTATDGGALHDGGSD
jgi:hypothetical protein